MQTYWLRKRTQVQLGTPSPTSLMNLIPASPLARGQRNSCLRCFVKIHKHPPQLHRIVETLCETPIAPEKYSLSPSESDTSNPKGFPSITRSLSQTRKPSSHLRFINLSSNMSFGGFFGGGGSKKGGEQESNQSTTTTTTTGIGLPAFESSSSPSGVRQKIQSAIVLQGNVENAKLLIQKVNENCFDHCITNPGSSLSSKDQTCLSACMEKYIDAWNLTSRTYQSRLHQDALGSGLAGGLAGSGPSAPTAGKELF